MLRLEVWTEPSETGLLGLQLGAWDFGADVACRRVMAVEAVAVPENAVDVVVINQKVKAKRLAPTRNCLLSIQS